MSGRKHGIICTQPEGGPNAREAVCYCIHNQGHPYFPVILTYAKKEGLTCANSLTGPIFRIPRTFGIFVKLSALDPAAIRAALRDESIGIASAYKICFNDAIKLGS